MIDRRSRCERIKPVRARMASWVDMVLGAVSSALATSPAAIPSGPAFTSSRKTANRPEWAKADSASMATSGVSIGN